MSVDRIEAAPLFGEPSRACIFVTADGAAPRGWPFVVRPQGSALWCTTYAGSAKMAWIAQADQATCLVFSDEDSVRPYSVVDGTIHVVPPTPERVSRWFDRPVGDLQGVKVAERLLAGKRVFLVVRPVHPVLTFQGEG